MKRSFLGIVFAIALAAPSVAAAPSAGVTRQVHTLLNAPEHVPSAAEWTNLGSEAGEVLRAVAVDGDALLLKRGRAVSALIHFESDATRAVLADLLTNADVQWLLKGKAATAFALAFPEDAVAELEPLVGHDDKRVREGAIKALGLVPSADAQSLLKARLSAETNEHLKSLIQSAIATSQAQAQAAKKAGGK